MFKKRDSQRSPIELAASFGIDASSKKMQEAQIINVSAGGFCFSTPKVLEMGLDLFLNVEIDQGDSVQFPVKVAWSSSLGPNKKCMTGVRITDISTPDYQRFLQFYSKLNPIFKTH